MPSNAHDHEVRVPGACAPVRLDVFLAQHLPQGSRRLAQRVIAAGWVRVNGRRVRKGQRVAGGDVVQLAAAAVASPALAPEPDLSVAILYADDVVVALDKPAGMPSHALRPDERRTIANFLLARFPETGAVGRSALEPGIVHRLDTDTSGVLLAARTPEAHAALRRQFAQRQVRKQYVAIVAGDVAAPGEVRAPIAAARHSRRRVRVAPAANPAARAALTTYQPLERFGAHTLVAVHIATGVRHQIRAHLAAIGHPVLGDRLYGSADSAHAPRQMLHACRLELVHPGTGCPLQLSSPMPTDMHTVLAQLRHSTVGGGRPTTGREQGIDRRS